MGLEKRPYPDTETKPVQGTPPATGVGKESRGIDEHIADEEKAPVRNTPPAGEWNDVAPNEAPSTDDQKT